MGYQRHRRQCQEEGIAMANSKIISGDISVSAAHGQGSRPEQSTGGNRFLSLLLPGL